MNEKMNRDLILAPLYTQPDEQPRPLSEMCADFVRCKKAKGELPPDDPEEAKEWYRLNRPGGCWITDRKDGR